MHCTETECLLLLLLFGVSCFPFKSAYFSGGGRAGSANDNKDIMYYCVIAYLPMVSMFRVRSKDREQGCFFVFFSVLAMFSSDSQGVLKVFLNTFIPYALAEHEPSYIYINYKPGVLDICSGV